MSWTRPDPSEVETPYRTSFDQVPDGHLISIMESEIEDTTKLLATLGEERGGYRYAPGKWSVKEVIGHLCDSERIMSYRALAFARGETVDLPGYEQDDYVVTGRFDERTLEDVSGEFSSIRRATLTLFRSFPEDVLTRRGRASGCAFTVRGLAYVMCGHEIHHKRILRERYVERS